MQLIDGKAISEQVKQEIAAEVAEIVAQGGKRPHLAQQFGRRTPIHEAEHITPVETEIFHGAVPGAAVLVAGLGDQYLFSVQPLHRTFLLPQAPHQHRRQYRDQREQWLLSHVLLRVPQARSAT